VTLKRTEFKRKPDAKGLSRSSTLVRGGQLSRKTRLAQVSKKRKDQHGEWEALKALVRERDENRCQAAGVWASIRCSGEPLMTVHHKDPTGMGYPRICSPDRAVCLCWAHHVGPGGVHNGGQSMARTLGLLHKDAA
jgi:hypothetical protein